jgi:alkylated DNA repair dioxygenase AlkB
MDLFGDALIPGLRTIEDLVSPAEEQELIARLSDVPLTPFQYRGFSGRRLTRSFGWHYDFRDGSFTEAEPVPAWLLPLRHRAAAWAGLESNELQQALLTRYDPGAGIGWHKDRPVFDHVIGVSLGAPATMAFRRRTASGFRRHRVPLPARSAYLLTGEVRHEWEHGIASHDARRFSVTFRTLSATAKRMIMRQESQSWSAPGL